ncbi:MAG TPA: hypothetical protein VK431_01555 [Nitrosopumilaceae archaeon]|nr:hypothetical protein [Nitrosopumilaceae archaeon]
MNQTLGTDRKILLLSFVAAGTTVIAGILHLTMAPRSLSHDMGQGILFLVGGIAQIFWAVPVIKRWGRVWQIIGIVGTAVFVILYYLNRFHLLPEGGMEGGAPPGRPESGEFPRGNFTGGEGPRGNGPRGNVFGLGGNSLPIEICQIAFIGLYSVLSKLYSKSQPKKNDKKSSDEDLKK